MCQILNRIFTDDDEVSFYTNGSCDNIIRENLKCDNLLVSSYVSHDKILNIMKDSDILLSIGNAGRYKDMLPSKIFEYISYGKKIIHFYSDDNDRAIYYLEKYEGALVVDVRNENIDYNSINEFVNKEIEYSNIIDEFEKNTPNYTARVIIES